MYVLFLSWIPHSFSNLIYGRWLLQGKASIVRLQKVITGVVWQGVQIDMDEVECIVANLIFDGHIKGYISHQKNVLVLSEKGPFPRKEN
jgi:hypothetical protein